MELYLDTSDVAAVKALARIFPLAGVTTNPTIMRGVALDIKNARLIGARFQDLTADARCGG